jgi:hypothetical protein
VSPSSKTGLRQGNLPEARRPLYLALAWITTGTTEDAVVAPWRSLALIPIGTVLVVVAATSIPVRLATRIRTADALRYE